MEQDNATGVSSNATLLCGKSWTAYLGTVIFALVALGLMVFAFNYNELAAAIVLAIGAVVVIYRVLVIRSYQLYYDDVGVWLYSGILPWSKGVAGVKWRDMDEATFVQNFWSWLFKSYSIRIGHRFTKSSEIFLSSMARGKDAVATLNARHQEMIRSQSIV